MRTVTALYATREDAEAAQRRLEAGGFTQDVEIHAADEGEPNSQEGGGLLHRLKMFFGGHDDVHAYDEGLRRGHFLLTAKVGEGQEERAGELMDAMTAMDLGAAQQGWRDDGWSGEGFGPGAGRVRSYPLEGDWAQPGDVAPSAAEAETAEAATLAREGVIRDVGLGRE
ncbi:MAG: hypothetical protein JOZ27_04240, partial [Caulobacteraceae bacterium]|nr:hypothetical protein [Caulobacteraceae bacterium]